MPTEQEIKHQIEIALQAFANQTCTIASIELLNILGYESSKTILLEDSSAETFLNMFNNEGKLNTQKAWVNDWNSIELLFQITDAEINARLVQDTLFKSGQVDQTNINSYLFFSLCLSGISYTRTQLADITREINKLFQMPVMVLFTYNQQLSIAIIMRRVHKRDASKDVLEKVTY